MGWVELLLIVLVIGGACVSSYLIGHRRGRIFGYKRGVTQILQACNEAFVQMQKEGVIEWHYEKMKDANDNVIPFPGPTDKVH